MAGQIGSISKFVIEGQKLIAHGYDWVIQSVSEYDHWGETRLTVKAKKANGKKVFMMVIYENGTISGAV